MLLNFSMSKRETSYPKKSLASLLAYSENDLENCAGRYMMAPSTMANRATGWIAKKRYRSGRSVPAPVRARCSPPSLCAVSCVERDPENRLKSQNQICRTVGNVTVVGRGFKLR